MSGGAPICAMMPLKISGSHYDENVERTRLLLDSLDRFLEFAAPLHLHVICVGRELASARAMLHGRDRVRLEFWAEEDVVPGIGSHRAIGWFKQQALKLAFARHCPTPFYLTLDPDILLCRPLEAGDLVADGRCFTSWMSKAEHPHWWAASADVLAMSPDPARPGLNVTPNVLARAIGLALGERLSERLDAADPFLALLNVDKRWTEYTLYSVLAEVTGLLDALHRPDLPRGRTLLGRSVWTKENFQNYSLVDIHEDASGAFFTVCASHTHIPPATLREMFRALEQRASA